jgi:hypothetical protein
MEYPGEGEEENIRYLINVRTSYRPSSKHFLNGSRTGIFGCFNSLTLSYSSKINGYLHHQRVFSEDNAAHPVRCDNPLQIVMSVF